MTVSSIGMRLEMADAPPVAPAHETEEAGPAGRLWEERFSRAAFGRREGRRNLHLARIKWRDDYLAVPSNAGLRIGSLKAALHFLLELRPPIARALLESPAHRYRQSKENVDVTRKANPSQLSPRTDQNSVHGIVTAVTVAAVQAGDGTPMLDLATVGLILGDLQVFVKCSKTRTDVAPPNCSA